MMDQRREYQVERLVDELTKPMFLYRFGRARAVSDGKLQVRRAGETMMHRSLQEIHDIVIQYARVHGG